MIRVKYIAYMYRSRLYYMPNKSWPMQYLVLYKMGQNLLDIQYFTAYAELVLKYAFYCGPKKY